MSCLTYSRISTGPWSMCFGKPHDCGIVGRLFATSLTLYSLQGSCGTHHHRGDGMALAAFSLLTAVTDSTWSPVHLLLTISVTAPPHSEWNLMLSTRFPASPNSIMVLVHATFMLRHNVVAIHIRLLNIGHIHHALIAHGKGWRCGRSRSCHGACVRCRRVDIWRYPSCRDGHARWLRSFCESGKRSHL